MESLSVKSIPQPRPPVVVVLGHVDHGKTTLLDKIRSTKIADREAGGITQAVGASLITTPEGKKITFIDTPGHAAFSNMRSQGAKVADVAILVVGADDGVKPQTKEALEHILASGIPFIVAVTKMDLPGTASVMVKSQLQKEGVLFEGSGGEVPLVEVSARTGMGVNNVLELISLISEVRGISGDPLATLEAVIIEVGRDKRGATASVIIRNGSLKVGDFVVSQDQEAKIRAIFDDNGKSVNKVFPGEPCLLLGFEKPPLVGSSLWHKGSSAEVVRASSPKQIMVGESNDTRLTLMIRAGTSGSLEAILENLPKECFVISSGVGNVTESDIFLAKADNAKIFTFEVSPSSSVTKLAEMEGVKIETFDIIYKLFERTEEILKKGEIKILGKAQVVAMFPFENKNVAGCRISQGQIVAGSELSLTRNEKEIGKVKVMSIKKLKDEVGLVKQGEECGILFVPQLDFKIGDVLISVGK